MIIRTHSSLILPPAISLRKSLPEPADGTIPPSTGNCCEKLLPQAFSCVHRGIALAERTAAGRAHALGHERGRQVFRSAQPRHRACSPEERCVRRPPASVSERLARVVASR